MRRVMLERPTRPTSSWLAQRRLPSMDAVSADIHLLTSSLRQLAAAVTAEARSVQHEPFCSTTAGCSATSGSGRKLLQAADVGIAAQLASLTAAASSSLGQVSVSSQQTSAAVDPVVVSVGCHQYEHCIQECVASARTACVAACPYELGCASCLLELT
jgi:hypothetical protein